MNVVDLFAGAGGFSTGAQMAGANVLWAANHWQAAVETHALNHPDAAHACQDLHQADWSQVPAHDVLLASPCCQGHSNARGKDSPQHDASRSTAWAVVSAAEYHRPEFAIVENVPEFTRWALFPAWQQAMETLGYALEQHVIDSADHGVPQHRVRLFIVATRGAAPVKLRLPKREHVPLRGCIDWDQHNWSLVEKPGRSPATVARARAGREQCGDRFVMPYYGSGSGKTGRSIDRPLGTVTTRDRWALVKGDQMRMLQVPEYKRVMGFPEDYQLVGSRKQSIHLLGNAVCPPVARDLIDSLTTAA